MKTSDYGKQYTTLTPTEKTTELKAGERLFDACFLLQSYYCICFTNGNNYFKLFRKIITLAVSIR
jgi:hypothetical protein